MKIHISDYFSLPKIAQSGQCFRIREMPNGHFRFITKENILYIKDLDYNDFEISCTLEDWKSIWIPYFDLKTNYGKLYKKFLEFNHPSINQAVHFGQGIRILRQDPWETTISFIISQNKNIPAIKRCIDKLCKAFGHPIKTQYETLYTFPTLVELSSANLVDLKNCGLGYRADYVKTTINQILLGRPDLQSLSEVEDSVLLEELETLKGVGPKVANCIALFGFGRLGAVPKDVWIKRSIQNDFNGENIYENFDEGAGVLQQLIFYDQITQK